MAEASEAAGAPTTYVPSLSDVGEVVAGLVAPGDTVLLLGAGDITTVAQSVTLAIRARP